MSVLIETSVGDIVVDLFVEESPLACLNFIKLCKIKYYNGCLFHTVEKDFIVQTGDPQNTGRGGESIWGVLYGEQARHFQSEFHPKLTHDRPGLLSTANSAENKNTSTFFFTTGNDLKRLDKKHTIFGEIVEGIDTLVKINEAYCDEEDHPYRIIRIRHTTILDDPFPDPNGLVVPDRSPEPVLIEGRLDDEEPLDENEGKTQEEIDKELKEHDSKARTEVLVMLGDLESEDVAPPENVIFICKLNPITEEEDLELIFSQFGTVVGCEIIRDHITGDSLCFGFIEFENRKSCERAYLKMDNVLIDDRRIHVDFSQSTSKNTSKGSKSRYAHLQQKEETSSRNDNRRPRLPHHNSYGAKKDYGFVFDRSSSDPKKRHKEEKIEPSKSRKLSETDQPRHKEKKYESNNNSNNRDRSELQKLKDSSRDKYIERREPKDKDRHDRDRNNNRNNDRNRERDSDRDRERGKERVDRDRRDRNREKDRNNDKDREREGNDRDRDRDTDRRERDRDRNNDRDRERHDRDRNRSDRDRK